jgi:hypothetical protein
MRNLFLPFFASVLLLVKINCTYQYQLLNPQIVDYTDAVLRGLDFYNLDSSVSCVNALYQSIDQHLMFYSNIRVTNQTANLTQVQSATYQKILDFAMLHSTSTSSLLQSCPSTLIDLGLNVTFQVMQF